MLHQHFLSAPDTDPGPLDNGERILWQGRCAVAEYAFDDPASLPRWTLPEETDILVTDRRVRFSHVGDTTERGGELFWLWPQHLRVQPGNRESGRAATVTQIQLVCGGTDGSYPALVFAGGELSTVTDADRLANLLRQAIARFRVEYADEIGVQPAHVRMLTRQVIGPEFTNFQGGEGQTVSLLGSVPVPSPEPADAQPPPSTPPPTMSAPVTPRPAAPRPATPPPAYTYPPSAVPAPVTAAPGAPVHAQPAYPGPGRSTPVHTEPHRAAPHQPAPHQAEPHQPAPAPTHAASMTAPGARTYQERPGRAADAERAARAIRADQAARQSEPDLALRASSLAARVASLISAASDDEPADPLDGPTANLSAYLNRPPADPR